KVLLDYCKELGFAGITNQLNGLEPDQAEALKERVKKGPKAGATPAPVAPLKPVIPTKLEHKVQTLPKGKPAAAKAPAATAPEEVVPHAPAPAAPVDDAPAP